MLVDIRAQGRTAYTDEERIEILTHVRDISLDGWCSAAGGAVRHGGIKIFADSYQMACDELAKMAGDTSRQVGVSVVVCEGLDGRRFTFGPSSDGPTPAPGGKCGA